MTYISVVYKMIWHHLNWGTVVTRPNTPDVGRARLTSLTTKKQ